MRNLRLSGFRLIAAVAALLLCFSASAAAETWYPENEYNFVDESMEIHDGIPENATGRLGQIKRNGVLRVAVDLKTPPMNFRISSADGDEQYAGVDMELARMIAENMGVQLVIVPMEPAHKLPSLTEGQCDLTISAITYTPSRAMYYTLSKGYWFPEETKDIGILIREGAAIHSMDDLANRIIITQSNSMQEEFGAAKLKNYAEFRRVSSSRSVFDNVENETADAGIVSIRTTENYLRDHPDCGLQLAEGPVLALNPGHMGFQLRMERLAFSSDVQYQGYRVAAPKGETQLAAFVNGVIDEASKAGLPEKWMAEAIRQAEESGN